MSCEWVFHTPMALISLQWWMVNDLEFGAEIILFLLVLLCVRVHVVLRQGILSQRQKRNWDTHAGLEHKILRLGLWEAAQQLWLYHKRVQSI